MKYVLASLEKKDSHQIPLENTNGLKTTHIRGYGFGVTFSSPVSVWKHTISTHLKDLRFYEPSVCCG